ncbi:RidA family protein [Actinophytocola oryzae]|uniref:Reactive intermediate/imine deaminase n=1 Tax=Actinophytocola oryzae TaxID=502181 RepID=A0A4R7W6J3_9PSEU|nr:Rid family hydrolase [Actinophytocola oryzae]TDV57915.1 reactive intermediate/imine deaminase [Actinophytocola oryzae]
MTQSESDGRRRVHTEDAPAPAGSYSQAVVAGGFVFLSGQTPRLPDGTRLTEAPFDVQARQVLTNLEAVARAAGTSLRNATMVTVYLRDLGDRAAFDEVYREFLGDPFPARVILPCDLVGMAVEVSATALVVA